MANYNGQNFTSFSGVNVKGSIALRFAADVGGNESTLSVRPSLDTARAWTLPDKSGTLPIMGTFAVQLPTAVGAFFSTIITAAGIRTEDALVVQLNGANDAARTYGFAQSTGHIITQVVPGNGNFTMYFQNPGNSTAYVDLRGSYLAMR